MAAALSTVIYPFFYSDVLYPATGSAGVLALIVRNVVMVAILLVAVRWLRAEARAASRSGNRVTAC